MGDELPRRCHVDRLTPAESAIRAAMLAVEGLGAHVLLTETVVLLDQARVKLADWVDQQPQGDAPG